jgi:phage-related holin
MAELLHPKAVLITLIGFFQPVATVLCATLGLVVFDVVAALLVARKKRRRITSHKFARSFGKLFVYFVLICLGHVLQTVFLPEVKVSGLIAAWIGVGEALSILEKINMLSRVKLIDRLIDSLKARK